MSNNLQAQFGVSEDTVRTAQPLLEDKGVEIKKTNKKVAKIKVDKTEISVPTAQYVDELESRVLASEKEIKKLKADLTNVRNAFNGLVTTVNSMQKALKGKMDKF